MHGGRSRYLGLSFFKDALSYLVIFLLSFPRFIKTTFYGSAHSEQSYEYILVYPSLWTKNVVSSCTSDYDLDFYPGAPNVKGNPCEIHEASDDSLAIMPNLISPISPSRYKQLQLPPILHDFQWNIRNKSPSSTGNIKTWLLRNMYKPLSISLTFLR